MMELELHRHDHFSLFDGFGNTAEMAKLAKEKGYTALGSSNHGNTSGLIKHYFDCKEAEIKPILGVEAYFQPKFNKDKKTYHLCLFAKNLEGFENINKIMTVAAEETFYKVPVVTFDSLERYNEGVICSSACIAGFIPQLIIGNEKKLAKKAISYFKDYFGENFYFEIQPYKLTEENLQENVNVRMIKLAEKYDVPCILTSDSHYGRKEDFDTYLKLHEINGTKYDIVGTYKQRYFPDVGDLQKRFIKMHKEYKHLVPSFEVNLEILEASVEDDIFKDLPLVLPQFSSKNSAKLLKKEIIKGLKSRGKYKKEYIDRCKEEFDIITYHQFENYFLIVQDYVKFAKKNNILVGPGRGSVCNSLAAYALGITEVDSIYFGLDFTRFLRKDKTALPDIDLDFLPERRHEVTQYILSKYNGQAARIGAYGGFKADNLVNDLVKVCGVTDKSEIATIKNFVKQYQEEDANSFKIEEAERDSLYGYYNDKYDNILKHFSKLYAKFRYFGTHAGGVAVSGSGIYKHTAIRRYKEDFVSVYDHFDIEKINAVKLDVLGLKALSEIAELEILTGEKYKEEWLEDRKVLKSFSNGNSVGIFQFESSSARGILKEIQADRMEDIIAASALNRPGPLSLDMPAQYANNKQNLKEVKNSKYFQFTKETFGTIVYQEQITAICRGLGNLSWPDSDKVLKMMKSHGYKKEMVDEINRVRNVFLEGCKKNGISEKEAADIHSKILTYAFNKGHATGYAILSVIHMFYKVYYPIEFWYSKLKYAPTDNDLVRYKVAAVNDGEVVIFLPHVNSTAKYSITEIKGEKALQEGLINLKNVGEKAAFEIEQERLKNGDYKSYDEFTERVNRRVVNKRVIEALLEHGALEFSRNKYLSRVKKYNSVLLLKGSR